jgi:GNAT superfamily N-acetyltransferase
MLTTREASLADVQLITSHRHAMFAAMPAPNLPVLDAMSSAFEPWVRRRITEGKYLGWIVEEDGRVAGSAGLLILDWPPHALHPNQDRRAYLLNVFVEPAFRRRGIARGLIERCLAEARLLGIRVVTLHASEAGRSVYQAFGFRPTSEMMYIDPATAAE